MEKNKKSQTGKETLYVRASNDFRNAEDMEQLKTAASKHKNETDKLGRSDSTYLCLRNAYVYYRDYLTGKTLGLHPRLARAKAIANGPPDILDYYQDSD